MRPWSPLRVGSTMTDTDPPVQWTEVEPKDATELKCGDGIQGPLNEMGEECPWPWDPEQLEGAPLGQYHCPYCGGMVVAGVPHPDWRELP